MELKSLRRFDFQVTLIQKFQTEPDIRFGISLAQCDRQRDLNGRPSDNETKAITNGALQYKEIKQIVKQLHRECCHACVPANSKHNSLTLVQYQHSHQSTRQDKPTTNYSLNDDADADDSFNSFDENWTTLKKILATFFGPSSFPEMLLLAIVKNVSEKAARALFDRGPKSLKNI